MDYVQYKMIKAYSKFIDDLQDISKLMDDMLGRKEISAVSKMLTWASTVDEEFKLIVDGLNAAKAQFIYNVATALQNIKGEIPEISGARFEVVSQENLLKREIAKIKDKARQLTDRYREFSILQQLDFSNFVLALKYEDILSECSKEAKRAKKLKDPEVESQLKLKKHLQ